MCSRQLGAAAASILSQNLELQGFFLRGRKIMRDVTDRDQEKERVIKIKRDRQTERERERECEKDSERESEKDRERVKKIDTERER